MLQWSSSGGGNIWLDRGRRLAIHNTSSNTAGRSQCRHRRFGLFKESRYLTQSMPTMPERKNDRRPHWTNVWVSAAQHPPSPPYRRPIIDQSCRHRGTKSEFEFAARQRGGIFRSRHSDCSISPCPSWLPLALPRWGRIGLLRFVLKPASRVLFPEDPSGNTFTIR